MREVRDMSMETLFQVERGKGLGGHKLKHSVALQMSRNQPKTVLERRIAGDKIESACDKWATRYSLVALLDLLTAEPPTEDLRIFPFLISRWKATALVLSVCTTLPTPWLEG